MEGFTDEGLVLSLKKIGEEGALLAVLTRDHGISRGYVRYPSRKTLRAALQLGSLLHVSWQSRLQEQLGAFTVEPLRNYFSLLFDDPAGLALLQAVSLLILRAFAEREPVPGFLEKTQALLEAFVAGAERGKAYVLWEAALLESAGFGLDLSSCASTGETENLRYLSPKTGRAVSEAAGLPYKDVLFPLPAFMGNPSAPASSAEIMQGLSITGHFLKKHLFQGEDPPKERKTFLAIISP